MKTVEEIKKELELIKQLKKQAWNENKYPCTQSAVSGIQLMAQQEILEWVLEDSEDENSEHIQVQKIQTKRQSQ